MISGKGVDYLVTKVMFSVAWYWHTKLICEPSCCLCFAFCKGGAHRTGAWGSKVDLMWHLISSLIWCRLSVCLCVHLFPHFLSVGGGALIRWLSPLFSSPPPLFTPSVYVLMCRPQSGASPCLVCVYGCVCSATAGPSVPVLTLPKQWLERLQRPPSSTSHRLPLTLASVRHGRKRLLRPRAASPPLPPTALQ